MLVFLKDVEFSEVKSALVAAFPANNVTKVIKDSDFLDSRNAMISCLKKQNEEICVLCIYDLSYLKWSLVYFYAVFNAARKKAYILDVSGNLKSITFLSLVRDAALSVFSASSQIWDVLVYKYSLRKLSRLPKVEINKQINENSRIAYVRTTDTYNLKAGGSLGHTVGMIDGYKNIGHKIYYLGIDDIEQVKGVEKTIVKPSKFLNLINLFNRYAYNSRFESAISKKIKERSVAFIYQRASRDNFSGVMLSKKFDIPLVLEFNSFLVWELTGANHFLHRLFTKPTVDIEKVNLEYAHVIVVVSEVLRLQLVEYGVEPQKILVAPNAVDIKRFCPSISSKTLRVDLNIPDGVAIAGFSGTFGFWHGIDVLVESITKISDKRTDCYFLLIGDGPYRKVAETKLVKFSNVIFTGIVPYRDIQNYLMLCDILLSPHNIPKGEKFIGSPTKLFEYMACGKIIIASSLDQLADVISPALSVITSIYGMSISQQQELNVGITVKPGSIEELTFAIEYAVDTIEELTSLGLNARNKAIKEHGWDAVAKKVVEKLDSLRT